MVKTKNTSIIPVERVARCIYLIRGEKVMLDFDLAELYAVPTSALNQAVKRNMNRFPSEFMFQLSKEELENWMSQFVISNPSTKMGLRKQPYAFTEHGVAMLSSVLRSDRAAEVNVTIIKTFIRLRKMLATNADLARKVAQHDKEIAVLFDEVQKLLEPPPVPKKRPIGFGRDDE